MGLMRWLKCLKGLVVARKAALLAAGGGGGGTHRGGVHEMCSLRGGHLTCRPSPGPGVAW